MFMYVLTSCHRLQSFWHLEVLESLVYGHEESHYFSKSKIVLIFICSEVCALLYFIKLIFSVLVVVL